MVTITFEALRNSQKFKEFRNAEMQSRNAEMQKFRRYFRNSRNIDVTIGNHLRNLEI